MNDRISAEGLDGVFDDESQVNDLLGIINSFKPKAPPSTQAPAPQARRQENNPQ